MKRMVWLALLSTCAACAGEQADTLREIDAGDGPALDGGADRRDASDDPTRDASGDPSSGDAGSTDGGLADAAGGSATQILGRLLGVGDGARAGVTVIIDGEPVVTNAQGEFALKVVVPYDIVLVDDADTYVFLDVTRTDPTLRLPSDTPPRSASVQGVVTGGSGFPLAANTYTSVTFAGASSYFDGRLNPGTGPAYGPIGVGWAKGASLPGTLVAVQYTSAAGTTSAPLAFAYQDVTLQDGETLGEKDGSTPATTLALASVTTRQVAVNVTAPQGWSVSTAAYSVATYSRSQSSPGSAFTIDALPTSVPASVPQLLYVGASAGTRFIRAYRSVPTDATLALTLLEGIAASEPADGATVSPDDALVWSEQSGAVTTVFLSWEEFLDDGTRSHSVRVATADEQLTLGRIRALGVDLPSELNWSVGGTGPWADVDAMLGTEAEPPLESRQYSSDGGRALLLQP